ncbi:MAG: hypothetical protein COC04_06480 [Gammaproteobacteria bacterium]|nr:MAG: hypothetical protein COC04_06480 [Gammaproteobacteria bacterium]
MISIIPNWHPILVHFTVALLSISVLFYFAARLLPQAHRWKEQWSHMANWSLWTGCVFTLLTVVAGWFAYNSVAHDSLSHAAMTLHRNWAIPTAILFIFIGITAISLARKKSKPGFLFLSISAVATMMLLTTAWLGAESVYRYGIGVLSLPTVESGADGHDHSHAPTEDSDSEHTEPSPMDEQVHEDPEMTTESESNKNSDSSHGHDDTDNHSDDDITTETESNDNSDNSFGHDDHHH